MKKNQQNSNSSKDLISRLEHLELPLQSKVLRAKVKSEKIMIVFHGRGDSIDPFFHLDEELKISDLNYLLLNARRRYDDGYSWYTEPPTLKKTLEKSRQQILEIFRSLLELGFRSENIYLLGFSQGGLLSSDLAIHFEKPLGGVIIISGYFYFFPQWRSQLTVNKLRTPWLIIHGRQDDVLPISETEYGAKKLATAGLNLTWKELNKDHSMGEEDARIIRQWYRQL